MDKSIICCPNCHEESDLEITTMCKTTQTGYFDYSITGNLEWNCTDSTYEDIIMLDNTIIKCLSCDHEFSITQLNIAMDHQIKYAVIEWINKQEQNKCWYYPEIFNEIINIFELTPPTSISCPLVEFKIGCEQYQKELYGETKSI